MTTQQNKPFVSLVGAITMIVAMVLLFYLAKGLFTILAWIAPVLLIITLIVNHNVVLNYGKWIFRQFKNGNWPVGLGATALTVLAFPIVSFFLFGKAMLMKKIGETFPGEEAMVPTSQKESGYTDYEIIDEGALELPELPKDVQEKIDKNDYENLI